MSSIIGMLLAASTILNGILIWYVYKIISKLLYTADNLGDLYIAFSVYDKFVKELYEMEMFYGEPILEELMTRTKMVREEIERFEEIYELTTDIESVEEGQNSDDEETYQEA